MKSYLHHFLLTAVIPASMHTWGHLVLNKIHSCSKFLGDPSFVCFELNLLHCQRQEVIEEKSFHSLKGVFFHASASGPVFY